METFSYTAVGADGKEKKGSIVAETREDAARSLKDQGLLPMSIGKQSALDKDINFSFGKKGVKVRDLSVFCRQFSSIIKAGVNVINALSMMSEQTENKKLKAAIKNVQSNVEKGETLSSAMRSEGDIFPSLLVSMVAAGEASGSLETAIERMAIQFEKDAKISGMVKKAMIYPIILIVVMIGVVIAMMMFVIPNFMDMFEGLDAEMPFMTVMVINMSNFILDRWWLLILIVVGIVFAYKSYYKTDAGRHVIDRIKIKIPVFGVLTVKTACARFSRIMSTLLSAGMPMISAIEIAAGTMDNVLFKDALQKVRSGVALGMGFSQQIGVTRLFPAMLVHMVGIGEETGNIEDMLTNVANYYDEEVELATQSVTALMEPMIIIVMAVVVGALVLAIYQPMITLYSTLG
ncbi:type II secretion system F family protein [[Bacteroides] pectinophilus]|jgi:type IV pilus assembly protein PilC|uniref:Type II secretion system protein GspF domain-containing protein n=1 Tax=[Bacteroides] pectinophilus ATCC 43243 TaxID=483218 RepID=B7ATN4_9FIRM|nr:bacterial type II secretion system domain protein F [[Bacteroides] pectinophilus ATCC 43243]UWN94639.1 type II secretion system F family protein [[Bacteroides] pectinophilus]